MTKSDIKLLGARAIAHFDTIKPDSDTAEEVTLVIAHGFKTPKERWEENLAKVTEILEELVKKGKLTRKKTTEGGYTYYKKGAPNAKANTRKK